MLHVISDDSLIYKFSKDNKSVLSVNSGDEIEFNTLDCFSEQIDSEECEINGLNWDIMNPASGPVYVNGAEKGDTLKVSIKKIQVKDTAVLATGKGMGVFQNEFQKSYIKIVSIEDGILKFNENVKKEIKPMIGVIGVAPEEGEVNCGCPGSHGGNMDNNMIGEGNDIYFPVFTKGALLAMGDVHAIMGDGEVCVTGAEVSAKITVKVEVIKELNIRNPILKNDKVLSTIASDEDLDTAVEMSLFDMLHLLDGKVNVRKEELVMLFSLFGNTEICQIVDPKKTARFVLPKDILKTIGCNL